MTPSCNPSPQPVDSCRQPTRSADLSLFSLIKVTRLSLMALPLPLNLHPGLDLQAEIWRKFHQIVGFSKGSSSHEFFLVASFGRCKFRLDSDSIGFLLQVALGGLASEFHVIQFSVRVFRFSISCREVGFLINHLQFFKCESFIVYFHLWNIGGANWKKEL
jgi:hypothetical protein